MLDDGTVLLEDGMEVDGVYWESDDRQIDSAFKSQNLFFYLRLLLAFRILFDNGTLIYKLSNITEQANIKYGTINKVCELFKYILLKFNHMSTYLTFVRQV